MYHVDPDLRNVTLVGPPPTGRMAWCASKNARCHDNSSRTGDFAHILNSPNDIVMSRSGHLVFADPGYGIGV